MYYLQYHLCLLDDKDSISFHFILIHFILREDNIFSSKIAFKSPLLGGGEEAHKYLSDFKKEEDEDLSTLIFVLGFINGGDSNPTLSVKIGAKISKELPLSLRCRTLNFALPVISVGVWGECESLRGENARGELHPGKVPPVGEHSSGLFPPEMYHPV